MATTPTTAKPAKPARITLVCHECGRRWQVSPLAKDPHCRVCGSVDWDVVDDQAKER